MTDRPKYAREIRYALTDARSVCERLGLMSGKGSFKPQTGGAIIRCPFHDENTPSCSVRLAADRTIAFRCHGCDATGDVLTLIACVHGLSLRSEFKQVLIAAAEMAGLWAVVHELESGAAPAEERAKPIVQAPPAAPERTYPSAAELEAVWSAAVAPSADPQAAAWLTGRSLDPERVEADVARVVAADARLPRWASYQGASWAQTGHRLIVPMRDPSGAIRSVRGVRIVEGDSPKRLPPGGHKATGLVMACPFAVAMLDGSYAPRRLLVVEGEPDFFVATTWRMDVPTARIGLVNGAWSPAFAQRVPVGCEVLVWTHLDQAGDRYAAQVIASLQRSRGCRLFRWSPKEVA